MPSRSAKRNVGRFIALVLALPLPAIARTAHFHVLGPGENSKRLVTSLSVSIIGEEQVDERGYVDWQMDVGLFNERRIAVRGLSERAPMTSDKGCGEFARYRVRLPNGDVFEYRHESTGRAVLPPVAFRELFLPTAEDEAVLIDGFTGAGQFLAHVIMLDRVTPKGPTSPVDKGKVLKLRPDLQIGTSRSFKDDGKGRPSPTANYNFIPLEQQDYEQLIAAGTNYFGVTPDQLKFVQNEPVFYRGPGVFPDDYYRSNFINAPMFTDEPMIRLGWEGTAPSRLDHPQQMASFLKSRVEHIYASHSALTPIAQALGAYGIHLSLDPKQFILSPTWETEYQAAFYELAGGAPGIVHEGRYVKEDYGWHPTRLFGPGLDVTTHEMLLCYYAFLRGAARAFDGDWGTSIYGQSDPAMRVEALTLAYDMGAKYLWFWTSDHEHHMEFPDQVSLARKVTEHAAKHPRKDLTALRDAAKVGIVFPRGYTLSWDWMWGQRALSPETPNWRGTAYREVVAAAMWEGVLCAKRGVPFDFTVDHNGVDELGYEELVFVNEDAAVRMLPERLSADTSESAIKINVGTPTAINFPSLPIETLRARPMYAEGVTVDGQLKEWHEAPWIEHFDKPSGEGKWDGTADLSMQIAFAYDTDYLYVAAVIQDDIHAQPFEGWELWRGDSIQIGLDPLNEENTVAYSGNQQEFGFALTDDGRAIAYKWHCRRGQRPQKMPGAKVTIEHNADNGVTVYEAAVPLVELAPFVPEVTRVIGIGVTVNDNDGDDREVFHETSPGAMTAGKHPAKFMKMVFETFAEDLDSLPTEVAAQHRPRVASGAFVWGRLVAPQGGRLSFDCLSRIWTQDGMTLQATLSALAPLRALPASSEASIEVTPGPTKHPVEITVDAEPGRYRLTIELIGPHRSMIATETMTVFVYPKTGEK